MNSTLRPHQHQALELLRHSLRTGHRRPLLYAPTGFGKTLIGAAIVSGVRNRRDGRVLFVAPAIDLIDQTITAFIRECIPTGDIGAIQASHPATDPARPVQVACLATLARRELPAADWVIIDEAHQLHRLFFSWMADPAWRATPFIGLSASPWTRGLGKLYDDLLAPTNTAELIKAGYLSPFRVFAPTEPDLTGVRVRAGDYREDDLAAAMSQGAVIGDVVATWQRLGENRPTLVFAVNRAHAASLADVFQAVGVPTEYVDGTMLRGQREALKHRFQSGATSVVVNIGTMTTGIDLDVRCIVLARPTKSEILHVQIVGRGLRTAPGKADCLILDHAGNHLRLGFVTDIHHATLDNGDAQSKVRSATIASALPRKCDECSALMPRGASICPVCQTPLLNPVITVDGELSEFGEVASKVARQRFYSGLVFIAARRGYRPGWVAHKFRARFGVWPSGLQPMAMPPRDEVYTFLQAEARRWRQRRAA